MGTTPLEVAAEEGRLTQGETTAAAARAAAAPHQIVFATNPDLRVPPDAHNDFTDPNYARLLLRRYGVPESRFVGNMLARLAE